MAGFTDFLKSNASPVAVGASALSNALSNLGDLTSTDHKLRGILNTLKDIPLSPLSMIGSIKGVQSVFKAIVQNSGGLEASMRRIATMTIYRGQLEPLLKSVSAAKVRLAELMQFSGKSPFNLGQVVSASKSLEIFTNGA